MKNHAQVILNIPIVANCIHKMLGCRVREVKNPLHSPLDRVKVLVKAPPRSLGVHLLGSAIVAAEERGWKRCIRGGHPKEVEEGREEGKRDVREHRESVQVG